MNYIYLSLGERYKVYALKGAKQSIKLIIDTLGRGPSTISRELKCNESLRGYRVNYADNKAHARRSNNAFTIIAEVWDMGLSYRQA